MKCNICNINQASGSDGICSGCRQAIDTERNNGKNVVTEKDYFAMLEKESGKGRN